MGEPFKLSEPEGAHGVKTKFLLRPISFFVDSSRHPAGRLGDGSLAHEFPMRAEWMTRGVSRSLPATIDKRPSPEELLRRVQAGEGRARRLARAAQSVLGLRLARGQVVPHAG